MRRAATLLAGTAMLLASAAPAMAHPTVELAPTLPTDLTHARTDNVEYLGRFPEHFGTAGGRLSEDGSLFYLTDPRGVFVYDTSDPESPELLGSLQLFQTGTGVALAQEDPDTDGHILLVDAALTPTGSSALRVVDVSDPTDLKVIGSVSTVDHTWTCVTGTIDTGETRGCAYAYGRTGHIIDLTDPTKPENLPLTWRKSVGGSGVASMGDRGNSPYVHDLTEIRPGLVMSAGASAVLMDTTDPAKPVEVARIQDLGRFSALGYHSVEWKVGEDGRLDRYVVLGTEITPPPSSGGLGAGSDCEGDTAVIEVWDASEVVALVEGDEDAPTSPKFTRTDTFDAAGRGIFLLGQSPGNQLYCAHWMDISPTFAGGGRLAISYYDRGTRFVDVDADGKMTEIGWIVAAEGHSGSARWITDEVVYIMDYRRGMEVVKVAAEEEATGVVHERGDVIAATSTITPADLAALTGTERGLSSSTVLAVGMLGLAAGMLRRRRAAARV
jgi:hypothetical protein